MRTTAAFAVLPVLAAGLIGCGGAEPIAAEPVDVSISSFSAHDPSRSTATVAIRFRPSPSEINDFTLEVVNRSGEDVVATMPVDKTPESDWCSRADPRTGDWKTFTIRGESAETLQLDSDRHELRLTIEKGSEEKRFVLDIPDIRCALTE